VGVRVCVWGGVVWVGVGEGAYTPGRYNVKVLSSLTRLHQSLMTHWTLTNEKNNKPYDGNTGSHDDIVVRLLMS
jgi:hypothetical protein